MEFKTLGQLRSQKERKAIRIFVVDDNPDFAVVAARYLRMHAGFEVVGCYTSAQQALDQIPNLQPDVVIFDLLMPGIDGLEGTRRVKKQGDSTRVIIVSFQESGGYREEAERLGADGFFTKMDFGDKVVPFIDKLFAEQRSEVSKT